MPELLSTRRQIELMRELQRLAKLRHAEEQRVASEYETGVRAARKQRDGARKPAIEGYEQGVLHAEEYDARARDSENEDNQRVTGALRREYQQRRDDLEKRRADAKQLAKKELDNGSWQIRSVYDAQKEQPRNNLAEITGRVKELREHLAQTNTAAADVLGSRVLGIRAQPPQEVAATPEANELSRPSDAEVRALADKMQSNADAARDTAQHLYDGWPSRLFDSHNLGVFLLAVFALAFAGGAFAAGFDPLPRSLTYGGVSGGGAVVLLAALLALLVRPIARKQSKQGYEQVRSLIQSAQLDGVQACSLAALRAKQHAQQLVEERDAELAALNQKVTDALRRKKEEIDAERTRIDEEYPRRLRETREQHETTIARLDHELKQSLAELASERDRKITESEQECEAEEQRQLELRDADWQAMRDAWLSGCGDIQSEIAAMRVECERLFPDWSATSFAEWEKPAEAALAVQFGRVTLDMAAIKHGLSDDPRLRPDQTTLDLPALITLNEQPSLLITAGGDARQRAVELLQAVALRFFTGQPPGKVRLTLLDPAGLGEGLSPFMHLADYEEDLIASRIWSEGRDIDQQLQRLTAHMETVIQKYLRSEYDTIHEYNAHAGEVAEPFQVVVVNGFPHNFSDTAARRLVSIATGGPRCGVYVLGVIDARQRVPTDFNMEDLKAHAVNLEWDDAKRCFVWRYPAFERLPLETAKPPGPDRMVNVLRAAGEAAKNAIKVEVPFSVVAPRDGFWDKSCGVELRVPVGRAGANRLQDVRLGKGTSQHLLVAGKTGSGKSTFLHALVTSAALHYSPDELEFYLVDFKKGVEFKSYANNRLPHARVIAIESEREFGLSVLERLDRELTRRGELYRECGAQNLADFRAARPDLAMPRILLVVDEFQELFVEDDRLAQESSLLMDRLVRQGRAFGIHVILGTQTLAGAYSIARSTLGQIAVRVALECSEADAHLILADERNQAARFLSRPGEAIYNDQNGIVSANEPFQVVWLSDAERAERLADLDAHRQKQALPEGEMIVFEGNLPADPSTNQPLAELLEARGTSRGKVEPSSPRLPPSAFFGDSVAIGPPTHAEFGRHTGANLLLVGPNEESALGVLTTSVISLDGSAEGARFVVLDGSRAGDASHGVWGKVAEVCPGDCEVLLPRDATAGLDSLANEVARREETPDVAEPPVYLIVWHGARLRDLRKSEDDFSFSMSSDDKPKSADKNLAEVLKNGPSVGVHVLVWCDGYNQAARMFDRSTMREFALRIAFQMSAADSSNLLDSPAAANLRQHRALFYSDETGESEKFRPYGPPSEEWLTTLRGGSAVRTEE